MKRTDEDIQREIAGLEGIKPRVKRRNFFGDDNHAAIDAQIAVLAEHLSEDDIHSRAMDDDWGESVRDSALSARDWMDGEGDIPSLVADWEELAS